MSAETQIEFQLLGTLYNRILKTLEAVPKDAKYRLYTEPLIQKNLQFVETERNISKLEQKLGYQVEESIKQVRVIPFFHLPRFSW